MRNLPLKRLIRDNDRAIPGFAVCDIESYKWTQFRAIGHAYKTYDELDQVKDEHYEYFTSLTEYCAAMFEDSQPHNIIFAHFGGKFDFSFLIKEMFFDRERYFIHDMLPRGSGILCMSVSTFTVEDTAAKAKSEKDILVRRPDGKYLIAKRTIVFRDSSAMLPYSLASLTKEFNVEHKKGEIDYDTFEKVTPEMLEYLEDDCWGLYEVIEKYFRWPMIREAGPAFTIASQSLRVFRTFLEQPISSLSGAADAFVRESYFGGRTEIFKPFYQQNSETNILRSYDVNSLYPFIMRELAFPGKFKYQTSFYKEDEPGFYDVEVHVPDMYVPPLGVRYKGMDHRLIFPTGTFRGIWSTMELNYAVSVGCQIKRVFRGMVFYPAGDIFKKYINYLYDRRKNSPKGSVENVLCKLIMNSTYGRFGLNLNREKLVFDQGQLGITPHMEIPVSEDGKHIIRLSVEDVFLESSFTNVAIAAWVTSGARVHMHRLISQAPEDMYYMDTDSLKTTHIYPRNDDDLGQLKLEYSMKQAVFLLPKTYIEDTTSPIFDMFDLKGKVIKGKKTSKKQVLKGFDRKKASHFLIDDFASALEGDMSRMRSINPRKFATLRTAVSKNEFLALIEEQPRQIRSRYNKRRVVKRPWAQVYDTEPLHIKNGEIMNLDKSILKKWELPTNEQMRKITEEVEAQLSL